MTNQTGFTLQDLVSYDAKHNEENGENNQDGPDYNYSWNCGAEGPSRKKAIVELRKKQIRQCFDVVIAISGNTMPACQEMSLAIPRRETITCIVRIMRRRG